MVMRMSTISLYENLYGADLSFCGLCQNEPVDSKGFHRGLELFNLADFYDAHEVWEDVWRAAPGPEKKFLQGLIQIAVGLHHHSTGNRVGARSLLARGARNLSGYSGDFAGIDLRSLLRGLADCQQALAEGHPLPRLPRIEMLGC
jgi:predicted metal-dependent hydrolase